MARVLFSIERNHPALGLSPHHYCMVGAFAALNRGNRWYYYYDCQGEGDRDQLAAKLGRGVKAWGIDLVVATALVQLGDRNVPPEAYGFIRDEYKVPVIMCWGESAPDVVAWADRYAPYVTASVFFDTAKHWRQFTEYPEKYTWLPEPKDPRIFNTARVTDYRTRPLTFVGSVLGRWDRSFNLALCDASGIAVQRLGGLGSGESNMCYADYLRESQITLNFTSAVSFQHINGRTSEATMCFPAGTSVLVSTHRFGRGYNLRRRSIDKVSVGDMVLTFNEGTSHKELKPITSIIKSRASNFVSLAFSNGVSLRVTAEHPFAQVKQGSISWIKANDLSIGAQLIYKCVRLGGGRKGKATWNKGLTKHDSNSVKKYADKVKIWAGLNREMLAQRLLKHRVGWREVWANPVAKSTIKAKLKALWQNPDYRNKVMAGKKQAGGNRPSSSEIKLQVVLNDLCPGEFAYNGGLQLGTVIGGYVPDFVNINGKKKIIDVFGCYWHGCDACGENNRREARFVDRKRALAFKEMGWEQLVIWEHEFVDIALMQSRVRAFIFNPGIEIITLLSKTIVPAVDQEVFNLSVAGNNNYFAEGVLVHNCGALLMESESKETERLLDPFVHYVPFKENFHIDEATGQLVAQPGDLIDKLRYYMGPGQAEARAIARAGQERAVELFDGRKFWREIYGLAGLE